jgi:hypothetical protein
MQRCKYLKIKIIMEATGSTSLMQNMFLTSRKSAESLEDKQKVVFKFKYIMIELDAPAKW